MSDRDPTEAVVTDALNGLEEAGLIDTEHDLGEEPTHSLTDDGTNAAEELLREKAGAQLLLLQIHWNTVCVEQESEQAALEELFRFVANVRDDTGENLLRAHQDHRDSVTDDPLPTFDESTLRRFDP